MRPFINGKNLADIEDSDLDLMSGMNQRIEKIGFLNQKISEYLITTSKSDLSSNQSKELFTLVSIVNYLGSMNDLIKLRFVSLVSKKEGINEEFSETDQREIADYHKRLLKQVKRLDKFFVKFDRDKMEKIVSKVKETKDIENKYKLNRIDRIKSSSASNDKSSEINQLHSQLMDVLKQVNIFINLIADALIDIESENL